ncbi:MAG: GAF domain-containing protein, partial [Saprospiraceae bacterium]|nr:GAF domain-containing protein [Saprospiraceae bacterium]
ISHLKSHHNELIVDLDSIMDSTCDVSGEFDKKKIGSYAIFPISVDGELLALLEMSSHKKGMLDGIVAKKFENIKTLFNTSIKRYLRQYDVNLEAIIKEKCTAIHPTVEWKFKQEAETYYRNKLNGLNSEMTDIDFPGVHPLYGQIDIKDSSLKRNAAIKNDLMDQLKDLQRIIENAFLLSNLPYYGQLLNMINTRMSELGLGLGVGDEVAVLDFIKREVEPNLEHIESLNMECARLIAKYQKKLKSNTNAYNKRRNQYESSVNAVTSTITEMMIERQLIAQEMFPHYYEKYKTDGVEHNIYIGDSLVKGRKYYDLYLKNIRLWQIMSMIEIENRLKQEHDSLKVKMNVCSLILVHSNAITIRFRMDEKKFDVEGAYNIRYEIIKKRIDKSLIQKTKERLTQPGKLAIVFAHPDERLEYIGYLKYMESLGYIKPGIEVHDLAPVQGINGLRALRVSINYDQDLAIDQSMKLIEAALN